MDEDTITDTKVIYPNLHRASCFGKTDRSDAHYQIELDGDGKEYAQSKHRDCTGCAGFLGSRRFHQFFTIASTQLSKESRVRSFLKTYEKQSIAV